jgi:cytoskeletal protein RodZ
MERRDIENRGDVRTGPGSGTVVDASMSLALWLRAGRAQRGLSLEDVARVTKIQARILERLETGKLDGLPADVFVRGFVRSFAKCVGLDEGEALKRYSACGNKPDGKSQSVSVMPSPAARAVVEAMGDLAPSFSAPRVSAASAAVSVEIELHDTPVIAEPEPPASAELVVAAPVVVTATEPVAAPPAKKKRMRGSKRKRKAIAVGTPFEALPVVQAAAGEPVLETSATTEVIATSEPVPGPTVEAPAEVASEPAVSEPQPEPQPEPIDEAIAFHMLTAVDHTAAPSEPPVESSGTWQPTMPAPGTLPTSAPWRTFLPPRPSVKVAPSLVAVIDDADPDRADHAFEERRHSAKERGLSAFLPPILLDREDRSARQGGLTLAVIILLIAATLALSYLMRRPSASGDGVTQTATEQLERLA